MFRHKMENGNEESIKETTNLLKSRKQSNIYICLSYISTRSYFLRFLLRILNNSIFFLYLQYFYFKNRFMMGIPLIRIFYLIYVDPYQVMELPGQQGTWCYYISIQMAVKLIMDFKHTIQQLILVIWVFICIWYVYHTS